MQLRRILLGTIAALMSFTLLTGFTTTKYLALAAAVAVAEVGRRSLRMARKA